MYMCITVYLYTYVYGGICVYIYTHICAYTYIGIQTHCPPRETFVLSVFSPEAGNDHGGLCHGCGPVASLGRGLVLAALRHGTADAQ